MRKSKKITLTILTLIAINLLIGCDEVNEEVKHCVDENDVVIDDKLCEGNNGVINPAVVNPVTGFSSPRVTRWYYGGTNVFSTGTKVSGGSYAASPGKSYSSPTTISRGGFGSTGRGISAGAGE